MLQYQHFIGNGITIKKRHLCYFLCLSLSLRQNQQDTFEFHKLIIHYIVLIRPGKKIRIYAHFMSEIVNSRKKKRIRIDEEANFYFYS